MWVRVSHSYTWLKHLDKHVLIMRTDRCLFSCLIKQMQSSLLILPCPEHSHTFKYWLKSRKRKVYLTRCNLCSSLSPLCECPHMVFNSKYILIIKYWFLRGSGLEKINVFVESYIMLTVTQNRTTNINLYK